ncbi:hypothetical protein F4775DRAFT_587533 [Biscogniauxia sp. FL1348]|nr:hypothetical protein F4775DRAFT_587533 [Biscogniauxia sp. FL1348]
MAPLKVGIVGAGIGGLSAAIALRRAGADVEIFEKSTFKDEVGAAITITPNGARILESWGLDAAPPSPSTCPSKSLNVYASAKARAVEATNLATMPAQTLRPYIVYDVSGLREEFGAPMRFYHRADLHRALSIMAMAPASWFAEACQKAVGEDGVLRLATRVVEVDCEEGTLKLEDGNTIKKDLLVIADGIQSRFVKDVTEHHNRLKDTGWSAYRFLIPMSSVLEDPEVAPVYGAEKEGDEDQPPKGSPHGGYRVACDAPRAFYVVAYPCRGNELLSVMIRHSHRAADGSKNKNIILDRKHKYSSSSGSGADKDEWEEDEDEDEDDGGDGDKHAWNAHETPHNEVLRLVAPYHPALCKLVLMATDIRSFRMRRREPLERYHRGRAVLLGDAAGAVWPTHAQGSVLAIEEAAALEALFSRVSDASAVPARLELYTAVLKRHIHLNQHLSESMPGNNNNTAAVADQPRRKAERLWNLLGGAYDTSDADDDQEKEKEEDNEKLACEHERRLFSFRAYNFSPEVRRFFYSFDVVAEIKRALEGTLEAYTDGCGGDGDGDGDGGKMTLFGEGVQVGDKEEGKGEGKTCGALHKVWLEICGKKGLGHGTI